MADSVSVSVVMIQQVSSPLSKMGLLLDLTPDGGINDDGNDEELEEELLRLMGGGGGGRQGKKNEHKG